MSAVSHNKQHHQLDVKTPVKNIMGGVIINGIIKKEMELDTAACHCIISAELWKEIVLVNPDNPPTLEKGSVNMTMADGTQSRAVMGSTHLTITRADKPQHTGVFLVIVVYGPHILLGRPALQALWPEQYGSLAQVAQKSLEAICSVCSVNAGDNTSFGMGAVPSPTTATPSAATATTTHSHLDPLPPTGNVTQEQGEQYLLQLCKKFGTLFDGEPGLIKGAQ